METETNNPLALHACYFPLLRKDHTLPAHHGGRFTGAYLVSPLHRIRCDAMRCDPIRFDPLRCDSHLPNSNLIRSFCDLRGGYYCPIASIRNFGPLSRASSHRCEYLGAQRLMVYISYHECQLCRSELLAMRLFEPQFEIASARHPTPNTALLSRFVSQQLGVSGATRIPKVTQYLASDAVPKQF